MSGQGATPIMPAGGKAVSIPTLGNYQSYGELVSSFGKSISESLGTIKIDFMNKTDGSEGAAIEAYLNQLEAFEAAIYESFPAEIETIGGHFNSYGDSLVGMSFEATGKVQTDDGDVARYLNRVTGEGGEQRTAIDGRITALQSLLEEVNGYAGTSLSTSAIKTTIETDLSEHATSTNTLHSNVLEAQTTFIAGLVASTGNLTALNSILDRVVTISAQGSGLRPSDIKGIIVNQTSTPEEISSALAAASTAEDAKALNAYLRKDFVAFFSQDPNVISEGAYQVVAGGMAAIMSGDNKALKDLTTKNFEKGVNSLITEENTTTYGELPKDHRDRVHMQGYNGYISGTKTSSDFHSSRLNDFMAKLSGASTLYGFNNGTYATELYESGQITKAEYDNYMKQVEATNYMVGLFDNIYLLKLEPGEKIGQLTHIGDGGFTFTEHYKTSRYVHNHGYITEIKTRQIQTNHVPTEELVEEDLALEIKELQEAKRQAVVRAIADLVMTLATAGGNKYVEIAGDVLLPMFSGNSPMSMGADMLSSINDGKMAGVTSNAMTLLDTYMDLQAKQDMKSLNGYANFFDMTGTKTAIDGEVTIKLNSNSFPAVQRMQEFEENGAQPFIDKAMDKANVTKENGVYYIENSRGDEQPLEEYLREIRDSNKLYQGVSDEAITYFLEGKTGETSLATIDWKEFNDVKQLFAAIHIPISYK